MIYMFNQEEKENKTILDNVATVNYIYGLNFQECTFQDTTIQTIVQQNNKQDDSKQSARKEEEVQHESVEEEPDEYSPDNYSEAKNCSNPEHGSIPEELQTKEAREIMERMVVEGILDEAWQPVNLSMAEKGALAALLSDKLAISTPWKVFSSLWGMSKESLRTAQNRGMNQPKTGRFIDRVKKCLN